MELFSSKSRELFRDSFALEDVRKDSIFALEEALHLGLAWDGFVIFFFLNMIVWYRYLLDRTCAVFVIDGIML